MKVWSDGVAHRPILRYEGMESRCRCSDMEVECMEVWTHAAGVTTWRYGAMESRCRCVDVEVSRYGVLESRCCCADVERMWKYRGTQSRSRAAVLQTRNYRGI